MLKRCCLLLAILSCVRTREDLHRDGLSVGYSSEINRRFSLWPSVHNAATLMRIRRESQTDKSQAVDTQAVNSLVVESQVPVAGIQGPNEGLGNTNNPPDPVEHTSINDKPPNKDVNATKYSTKLDPANNKSKDLSVSSNSTPKGTTVEAVETKTVTSTNVTLKDNGTNADTAVKQWDLSNPGATKRGLIVFGGFALLAMAYFVFYRTKSKFSETNNANNMNESNQFRYGVLQSDDRRDNLELSRVPLTMESDEEEDDDLEIFDLEQKKKSLSYVNLQANDEDIVLSPRNTNERDDLLLDIEDGNSDTLINWSNNPNKSIL